jgi:hypothetical protein
VSANHGVRIAGDLLGILLGRIQTALARPIGDRCFRSRIALRSAVFDRSHRNTFALWDSDKRAVEVMNQRDGADAPQASTIVLLAGAIERHAARAGDHVTALPALSFHRRDAPTEPVHCVYDFGLAVTMQGRTLRSAK